MGIGHNFFAMRKVATPPPPRLRSESGLRFSPGNGCGLVEDIRTLWAKQDREFLATVEKIRQFNAMMTDDTRTLPIVPRVGPSTFFRAHSLGNSIAFGLSLTVAIIARN